ncbi:MAG: hypothetical protein ACREQ9_24005, partial [Candidatus Binatia bacterium]
MRRPHFAYAAIVLAVSCALQKAPEPEPLVLAPPPPPAAKAGEIRIFGHRLPEERARGIRARLRAAEPK